MLTSKYNYEAVPRGYVLHVANWHSSNDPYGDARRSITGHLRGNVPPYICEAVVYRKGKPEEIVATGISICSPKDTPSKKIGRFIATGRAIKNFFNSETQMECLTNV